MFEGIERLSLTRDWITMILLLALVLIAVLKFFYGERFVKLFSLSYSEKYFTNYIVNVYHQQLHTGIDMPPIEKWREGILGKGKKKGIGLPKPATDPERLRIDFMPYEMRSVQRDGIAWHNVHYFADVLRPLIKLEKGGKTVKFLVRRDPRDISKLYFLDHDVGEYFEIPYRDLGKPSVSLWEFNAAVRELKRQGLASVDEDTIFETLDILQEIEEAAVKSTVKTRRQNQRRKNHAPPEPPFSKEGLRVVIDNTPSHEDDGEFELNDDDIKDDWEDWT